MQQRRLNLHPLLDSRIKITKRKNTAQRTYQAAPFKMKLQFYQMNHLSCRLKQAVIKWAQLSTCQPHQELSLRLNTQLQSMISNGPYLNFKIVARPLYRLLKTQPHDSMSLKR